jgi:hypothetical protein
MKYLCPNCMREHWGYNSAALCCPDVDKHGEKPIYIPDDTLVGRDDFESIA